ncbi:hypothetical protein KAR91_26025 [Candidatus Pacearchaeota archaeon]|nr:hypothetical protein [Candidatus Pacearchaeota archaeon]
MIVKITVKFQRRIGGTGSSYDDERVVYSGLPFIELDIFYMIQKTDIQIDLESMRIVSIQEARK